MTYFIIRLVIRTLALILKRVLRDVRNKVIKPEDELLSAFLEIRQTIGPPDPVIPFSHDTLPYRQNRRTRFENIGLDVEAVQRLDIGLRLLRYTDLPVGCCKAEWSAGDVDVVRFVVREIVPSKKVVSAPGISHVAAVSRHSPIR